MNQEGSGEIVDPLQATLLDLLYELREADLPLILGGGYGLFLRQKQVIESRERLLLTSVPPLRSTNDLDFFLRTELMADSTRLKPLREALDRLGFTVIASAQNYQFARVFRLGGQEWDVKIDLLTRKPDRVEYPRLKFDARRVSPHPSVGVHAHTTPEAVAIEADVTPLTVDGQRTDGAEYSGTVYLPTSYAFLMMKLFALRDQWQNDRKDYGRKHALDVYTVIAMLTEAEFDRSLTLRNRYQATAEATEAALVVAQLFADGNAPGSLRLREHPNFPRVTPGEWNEFLRTLTELFPLSLEAVI